MTIPDSPIEELPQEVQDRLAESFIKLRFRGGRFESAGGGMPLAAMEELTRLNDLVLAVAKVLWRKRQNKQRVHDYPEQPILRVSTFLEGSTIPDIVRDGESSVLTDDPYDESRDLVERTFWSIVAENKLPTDFPLECVDELRRVGKSLAPDEGEEFLQLDSIGRWKPRLLTKELRDSFWSNFDTPERVQLQILGRVTSLNRNSHSFSFERLSGQKLQGEFISGEIYDDLHAALGTLDDHPYCRLTIEADKDYMGRVRKIRNPQLVEVLEVDPMNWRRRFEQIAEFQPGWMPGASAVESTALERTDQVMRCVQTNALPEPAVFASFDGGTHLVWTTESGRTTLYVETDHTFEVESVPDGPVLPHVVESVEDAIAKVKESLRA